MELIIRPFAPDESALFYSNGEKDKELGCIGHLRGDFGSGGKEFWSTWWEHQSELKTQEFKDEFDVFINSLRKQGLLKDRLSMADYCCQHSEAKIPGACGIPMFTDSAWIQTGIAILRAAFPTQETITFMCTAIKNCRNACRKSQRQYRAPHPPLKRKSMSRSGKAHR